MKSVLSIYIPVVLALFAISPAHAEIDFAHDIAPILKTHCIKCHAGEKKQGGLSMDSRELLLVGGESGAAVKPRDSTGSLMIQRIIDPDAEQRMPPDSDPVSATQVEKLRQWIDAGAGWEEGFTFTTSSYEPQLAYRSPELPPVTENRPHPIDRILDKYLIEHSVERQPLVSDAAFLRRVSLDVVGLLPTRTELESFIAETSPTKRPELVADLLANEVAYAEHWLTFWNDLLRNDYTGTGFITGGRQQITGWLYQSLLENKPYDQFSRELIDAKPESVGFIKGIRWRGNVSASQREEIQFAQNVSQSLLGINMKCASCHDSFIDRWKLDETYGLAAIYATEPLTLHRCDKALDQTAAPAWMFPELGQVDVNADQPTRMKQLAALMTHQDNGRFARTIVNRIWHRLMGHGIVHPVDAMHTEPWSEDLLDYLAIHLRDNGFDLKQTIALICTSEIYQSQTAASTQPTSASQYVFRGPQTRRMTAEQLVDAVWQLTDGAPRKFDARVLRFKRENSNQLKPFVPTWIWSNADASVGAPAGETIVLRHKFDLPVLPTRAFAGVTCDNSYRMYVNGQHVESDGNWESIEAVSLLANLQQGTNELLIEAKNGGADPNPAGFAFEAVIRFSDDMSMAISSRDAWQWTAKKLNARGKFGKPPEDWQMAVPVSDQAVWGSRVDIQLARLVDAGTKAPVTMVRASVVKNNAFMRALGRPNRDQIVTSRPTELTTLEAIDLANGTTLAESIQHGAKVRMAEFEGSPEALVTWLYQFALSRRPTSEELQLGAEFLGTTPTHQAVEDLLWAVIMLPEFQLVR